MGDEMNIVQGNRTLGKYLHKYNTEDGHRQVIS